MATERDVRRPRRSSSTRRTPTTKIATITFNRPDHLNAPTSAARLRYADLLRAATVDDDVKVVVIRGVGDDFGSGADLPEFMAGDAIRGPASRELRVDDPNVTYPPQGTFRHGATMGQWYANAAAGNRALQELKKISIVEAKGYCYGWHFYQCADADLVISSDDALFGHPSFRYCGWGPRMWTWVHDDGAAASSRRWSSPAGRSPPRRWWRATSSTRWWRATNSRPRSRSTPWRAPVTAPSTASFMQKMFFEVVKQFQGEYMGSLLSAAFESMGGSVRPDGGDFMLGDAIDAGLADGGQRQRREVPARIPAEQEESQEEGLTPLLPLDGYIVIDLSTGIAGAYCTQAARRRRRHGGQSRTARRRSAAAVVGVGCRDQAR